MRIKLTIIILAIFLTASRAHSNEPEWGELFLKAKDEIVVYGYTLPAVIDPSRPVILLFHQAGTDGRGEYARIAPRLVDDGFQVLTIDARSGGNRFSENRTVTDLDAGQSFEYCDDLADLNAALAAAVQFSPGQPVILWGSSYSAALVFRLALNNQQVAGVIAFSPASGEPMSGCEPEPVLEQLTVPAIVFRPSSEMSYDWIAEQLQIFEDAGITVHVAENGVHGSSMLDDSRTKNNTDAEWRELDQFLDSLQLDP